MTDASYLWKVKLSALKHDLKLVDQIKVGSVRIPTIELIAKECRRCEIAILTLDGP